MTDPRYDPRFQRGWDGTVPPTAPRPASSPPAELASTRAAPARATAARSVAPSPVVPATEAAAEAHADLDGTDAPDSEEEAPGRRNPYRIALVALGAVLTLGSGGLMWQLAQPMTDFAPTAYVIPQFEAMVAPWTALAGLLTIIAAVALGVFRRR
ncbi:hypothetical protein [Pseudolysinimonas sp.]|uniref:hypothetical protein n=1 Tax=Pseudolysinimonas sp. TaxID=2680009 RepID=UPI003F7F9C08